MPKRTAKRNKWAPAHFHDEMYGQNYYVAFGEKQREKLLEYASETHNLELANNEGAGGTCWDSGDCQTYIWLTDDFDFDALVHECSHAALNVMFHRGVCVDAENQEAFCYYLQWIVGKMLEIYGSVK